MPLPFKVQSLDKVPEEHRGLYNEVDGVFVLDVDDAEITKGLKSTLAKVQRELEKAKTKAGNLSDEDVAELEQLRADRETAEEAKAREAGKFDELRAKIQEKADKEAALLRTQLEGRDSVIQRLTVTNEIMAALDAAGVLPEYKRAAYLDLKEMGPKVKWEDGKEPIGIFSDEIEGDQPIPLFVAAWVKTDAASAYMPAENGGGGGAGGQRPKGGKDPSWKGKAYKDMSPEEKVDYTESQYGEGKTAA